MTRLFFGAVLFATLTVNANAAFNPPPDRPKPQNVPETVINYLLYELAFYRAGFQWGHYYISTSDGMHFTLTDNIRISHDGNDGLRKVFEYSETYAPEATPSPAN